MLFSGFFPGMHDFKREIINFGQKIGAWGGGNFPLDYPLAQEYFSVVVVVISLLSPG
jgi:hypothetical protein